MISQKNGVSASGLQKILGLGSYQTAWTWLQKLRILTIIPDRRKLVGKVEVDETFIGGKKKVKEDEVQRIKLWLSLQLKYKIKELEGLDCR